MHLSLPAARALLLAAQGLIDPPPSPDPSAVATTIRRMGGLQIDTISVVARSQYLVLWSRLGAYEPRWLDELHAAGGLFEYWSRAICFLPIEDFPLYRWRMLERAEGDLYLEKHDPKYRAAIEHVLDEIRRRGPVRSVEFVASEQRAGQWWDHKPEKVALDHLFNAGVLMIARRDSMQRIYDLHERVLPGWDDGDALSKEESWKALALKAVQALGVATPRWVQWYFHDAHRKTGFGKEASKILAALAKEDQILPVTIEGLPGTAYAHSDYRDLILPANSCELQSRVTTFLSPWDPVVWDRQRASDLFGFDYRIEVYTPAPRRRYGYYTMPILHNGRLVGRLDPKAHRKEGVMEVKAIHLEPGVRVTKQLTTAIAATLRDFAAWHGTPQVTLGRTDPPELAERLRALL